MTLGPQKTIQATSEWVVLSECSLNHRPRLPGVFYHPKQASFSSTAPPPSQLGGREKAAQSFIKGRPVVTHFTESKTFYPKGRVFIVRGEGRDSPN
ncbi:hypothetical protein NQZ68_001207 [Dissostichus eleginoides]|nr:hypothetical protein NQZ68_001207 [Dissostichus eleginoides]